MSKAPSIDTKAGQRTVLYALIAYIDTNPNADLTVIRAALDGVVQHMHNRMPIGRAPDASVPMTPEVCDRIRKLHQADPDLTQQAIAEITGVNSGRVSETLSGKRG